MAPESGENTNCLKSLFTSSVLIVAQLSWVCFLNELGLVPNLDFHT